jgi:type IV fimbrial biogenesis protein FimT
MPPRCRAQRPRSGRLPGGGGFTLVELLLALAIAGMLTLASTSAFLSWLPRYHQRNQADALVQAFHLARAEAIKRGHRVTLCPTLDRVACDPGGRWERGLLVFADLDHDGDRDSGESIVHVDATPADAVTVRGNRPVARYVSYTSLGHTRLASGALQMGTFVVCRPGQDEIHVVLANGGRARVQAASVRCP